MRYFSGPYTQGQLLRDIHEIEMALTEQFLRSGVITDAAEQRSWRERVQDASFGQNTVIYDDLGNPSVMVLIPTLRLADVLPGGANTPHPAFMVAGTLRPLLYISKYPNIMSGAGATLRALSLRYRDPGNSINFDNARLACEQKGTGWHLMTNAEWAAIALWCKQNGFMPRGNNNHGADIGVSAERAVLSSTPGAARTLTGSGPLSWSHNGTPFGIFDLNGNVWEWVGGLRLNAGEIQVIPDNNAAQVVDQSAGSTLWQAILQNGSLVAPGTADTLKYDGETAIPSGIRINNTIVNATTDANSLFKTFETVAAAGGVTIPEVLRSLGLAPVDAAHGTDGLWCRNNGERLPLRGGAWGNASAAGVFALNLEDPRSRVLWGFGFRSAFVL